MQRTQLMRGVSAGAICLVLISGAAQAQDALPTIDVAGEQKPARQKEAPPGFSDEKKEMPVYREPTGQTFTTVRSEDFENTPLFTIRDMLQYSPGLSFKQGNGPRDIVVSIRGSSARGGFGVRNIVVMEDGFSVMQPDGLSRTDLTDPHAYAGVDVYRGPSSALFGNFANGGAINFRTRTGAEIDGVETGHEFDSFGTINNFTAIGKQYGDFDMAVFASDVRSDGFIQHFDSNTQTVNTTARYRVTPDDLLVFKGIHNELFANLAVRQSLLQYYNNPYQTGCRLVPNLGAATFGGAASRAWCGQISSFLNGVGGTSVQNSADLAGLHRNDRRDIFGLRWEHDIDKDTKLRLQASYDDKNIFQPAGSNFLQDEPAVSASADITHHDTLGGLDRTDYFGLYFNRTRYVSYSGTTIPVGDGAWGATTNKQNNMMQNLGARGREEFALAPDVTAVLGLDVELSKISGYSESMSYSSAGTMSSWTGVVANRAFWNFAPEASVVWRPWPEWQTRVRASSGFGTPNPSMLFVTQQGTFGSNIGLKSQRNTGFDIGVDWTPSELLKASLTLFHEWYQNEQLTQTPGAGLQSYTFNAPNSIHRGIEATIDYRPFDGWRLLANYSYNDQKFTRFVEQLGPGSYFDRSGRQTPNVAPHELTARIGYDQPDGDFKGLGAYVEYSFKSSYYLDNSNQLTIPGYGIVNLNLHYDAALPDNPLLLKNISAYFGVQNVFDRTYVASASNITNTLAAPGVENPYGVLVSSTGSIYPGAPRAFVGGVKFKF
ncbi:TonB-dependent receptor family protein [Methylosinus sporium]|uniref:TonB-dependent receptor family protein n=1 Tax=Methylosinus sporium TaxID=428 RepID=UPI00383AA0D2